MNASPPPTEPRQVFRRAGGRGWIVLSSALPSLDEAGAALTERLLQHMDLSRVPRVIVGPEVDEPALESFLEDVEAWLGIPAALERIVPGRTSDWSDAGLLVLAGGPPRVWVATLAASPASGSSLEEIGEGSLLYAVGPAAEALGTWVFSSGDEESLHGLGWLPGAAILTGTSDPAGMSGVREVLSREPRSYAVSLPPGSVLAIGPEGEIELWGKARPTVALGVGWRQA